MKKNLLTTTLLSLTLLSLNLSASNCSAGFCMVDLSSIATKKIINIKNSDKYNIRMIDNIETIVFSEESYNMSTDELFEYELSQLANRLEDINTNLPSSEYYCEENLKVVMVENLENLENTYVCA